MQAATTHDLTFGDGTVTKRYRRWDLGEHRREWDALRLLQRHRPGLAPTPQHASLDEEPPSIVMSRLPGVPIGLAGPVSPACLDAVAAAVTAVHQAVPATELAALPPRHWDPATAVGEVRSWALDCAATAHADARVSRALTAGVAWITSPAPADLLAESPSPVFGLADGNVANLLWDGERVRVVDFEDSGVSDRPFEVADLVEHISGWVDGAIDVDNLLARFDLPTKEVARLEGYRRLWALFWLLMLLPGNRAAQRNPAGTLERQTVRMLERLESLR